jgi:predicted peptidase
MQIPVAPARRTSLLLALIALSACGHSSFELDRSSGFIKKTVNGRAYYVYLPRALESKPWPVILYLHGGSERGDDARAATQVGLGPVAYHSDGKFPFIVVFPQAPNGTYWGMPDNNRRALSALDQVMAEYHGDPDRVYLTGNSLGGYGTWFMGALYPDRFAALVPICGGVRGRAPSGAPFGDVPEDDRPREIARRIGKTPVWIFHGRKDWLVPVRYSREMYEVLKREGGVVRYTELPRAGHDAWDPAYADPKLFEWLAAQRKGASPSPGGDGAQR